MNAGNLKPERIAILKPCCLGDCVMALPAIDAVIAAWPSSSIEVYVGPHSRSAFAFRPELTLRQVPDAFDVSSALQLSRVLRQGRYDLVIVLDRSRLLKTATRLSRAQRTAAVRSKAQEQRHETEVYLDVVREIGVPTMVTVPLITPPVAAKRRAQTLLSGRTAPIAILHPGGAHNPAAKMLSKRWPADRYVSLARELSESGVSVLLSGGPGDVALAESVAADAGLACSTILAGKADIETLAAILDRASVYIGPDTGVSHIAAATGTPTVAIFGPTNPRRYRPLGPDVIVLAPAASWQIPDRDLRRVSGLDDAISTELVSLDAVLTTTRAAIDRSWSRQACSE